METEGQPVPTAAGVPPEPGAQGAKPPWRWFLESTGGTALLTVVIGGLFGQVISCNIQGQLKDREYKQAKMKAKSDQDLVTHTEYLHQELDTVKRAVELIGSSVAASEDVIAITGQEFAADPAYDKVKRERLRSQREAILNRFNEVTEQWRNEHEKLGLLVSYYFHDEAATQTWRDLQQSVTAYVNCAKTWYYDNSEVPVPVDYSLACVQESGSLRDKLTGLQLALAKARDSQRTGADSRTSSDGAASPGDGPVPGGG
jgi:hypothetical protein